MFSTKGICSLFVKKTTVSPFSNFESDLGIKILSFLKIAPILISSGKFAFFKSLLISSDVSIISASITSYSPSSIVYAVSIVPL